MTKVITLVAVALAASFSSHALAQCPTCAGGAAAPVFSGAPSYQAPVYNSVPAATYSQPIVSSAPIYSQPAISYSQPIYNSAPIVSQPAISYSQPIYDQSAVFSQPVYSSSPIIQGQPIYGTTTSFPAYDSAPIPGGCSSCTSGCSTGCTSGCSTGCSMGCSSGCSTGCSTGVCGGIVGGEIIQGEGAVYSAPAAESPVPVPAADQPAEGAPATGGDADAIPPVPTPDESGDST